MLSKYCAVCNKELELTKENRKKDPQIVPYEDGKERFLWLHDCPCGNTLSTYVDVEQI